MKVCIGQVNTTPGDFSGNLERIVAGVRQASEAQCDLVVFPELTIPGYLSQDLLYNPEFIERNLEVLQQLIQVSVDCHPGLHIIVGYIGKNPGIGKPFTNMAGVLRQGELVHSYQKQLLPFYDVFDELRYFEPGSETVVVEIAGKQVGIAICEDLWNDKGADDYHYADNPLEQYAALGVDIVVSLNSSPYVQGKCAERLKHILPATQDGLSVVYVNQSGGQDELVFDGQSFIARDGGVEYISNTIFEDTYDCVELGGQLQQPSDVIAAKAVPLEDMLVLGLRDYARKSGFSQLVLASSGGVDSAVVCKLACDAVGASNVHAVRMPSVYSSAHSRDDARLLHEQLGCHDYEVPVEHESVVEMLNKQYSAHENNLENYSKVADENIQARLRDVYLMHFSNAFGAMPLSTGNKTESGCGYYTHFDMNFSYAPIKDLYKFQVVGIAKSDSRIPENIWKKPPSAELAHDQTDEASLMPYPILDPIVMAYVEDYVTSFDRFREWVGGATERKITSDRGVLDSWIETNRAADDFKRIVSLIRKNGIQKATDLPGNEGLESRLWYWPQDPDCREMVLKSPERY